jgi:hypothetical protein
MPGKTTKSFEGFASKADAQKLINQDLNLVKNLLI